MRTTRTAVALLASTLAAVGFIGCSEKKGDEPQPQELGFALLGLDDGSGPQLCKLQDGVVSLVKKINATGGSYPMGFHALGDKVLFMAEDEVNGRELWATDGTEAGTELVKDINPGAEGSRPGDFTELGGKLYFQANDGVHGSELWVSDGTNGGTAMVRDINPSGDSNPQQMVVFAGRLWFGADDGAHDYELWVSDGTEVGTSLFKDLKVSAGNSGGIPSDYALFGEKLFFAANDDTSRAVFTTDGTLEGTSLVKRIYPLYLKATPDRLYIAGSDGTHGYELWGSDGTEPGTTLIADLNPSGDGYAYDMTPVGGALFYQATDGVHGMELFRTDGTSEGTALVRDINPSGDAYPSSLLRVGDLLYFHADDGEHGRQIWVTDGTEPGTRRVTSINAAGGGARSLMLLEIMRRSDGVFVSGDLGGFYFGADDGTHGNELWVLDGSPEGAHLVVDFNAGAGDAFGGAT